MERLNTSIQSILIIDDQIEKYNNLNNILLSYGITCKIINNSISGLKEIEKQLYDCYLVSVNLKGEKVSLLIDRIKIICSWAIVGLVVENPTVEQICEYIRYGIDDVIIAPFQWDKIEEFLRFYNY